MADTSPENRQMYTAIHYDRFNGIIFIWYADGTRAGFKVKHRSYTPIQGQYNSKPSGMVDIYGRELFEIVVSSKEEMDIRQANIGPHNDISECDIDFRTRWLEEHYKKTDDLHVDVSDFNICFLDIEVAATDRFPNAEQADYPVNCVTIHFSKTGKYYTFGLNREISPELTKKLSDNNAEYINCPTERDLLTQLFTKIGQGNASFLSGWNAQYYDFPYLVNRASKLSVDIKLMSRLPEQYKTAYISKHDNNLVIGGTAVVDFLLLYRKFTIKEQDNFKLDTIGKLETGEQKAPLPDKYKSWIKYWDDWVWYNFKDVELMTKIEASCKMFDTTINACAEARVPFESIFETKKMEVGFILSYLHRQGIAMPPLKDRPRQSFAGAYVYAKVGYYTNLVSYDYGSMYPSFIMGANISPETKVIFKNGEYFDANMHRVTDVDSSNLVRSPLRVFKTNKDGTEEIDYEVFYRRDKDGIIPQVTTQIFMGRKAHQKKKKQYEREGNYALASIYDMKQKTYKIFGNGLYGLLGNPYFQFYDLDNSGTITAFGVELITYTIKHLCQYFEGEFKVDQRFIDAFGAPPNIDSSLEGSFEELNEGTGKVDIHYHRLSHGDTDSFFVKYQDIYYPFSPKAGKEVEVTVVKGNKIIYKKSYELATAEKDSKKDFNNKCTEYCPSWAITNNEDKAKCFKDGMLREDEYRVLYNRHSLTDFCRVLDAVLMEEVLSGIMQKFADKWNFMKNTLTLKREKCITQAIVTAKKKYICNVESNEDLKIYDANKRFKVTGLEIVRSSTTPFSRKFVLNCVKELLNTMDKKHIRDEYINIKNDFFAMVEAGKVYDLAIPSGIKADPPDYNDMINMSDEDKKKLDWRIRAGAAWNYLIRNDEVLKNDMHEPIYGGSKGKFLKIAPNDFGINSIAFVGDECPKRLLDRFNIDWNAQWETGFASVMNRLFVAVGWGEVEYDERDSMMDLM